MQGFNISLFRVIFLKYKAEGKYKPNKWLGFLQIFKLYVKGSIYDLVCTCALERFFPFYTKIKNKNKER